jgi:DNA-binding XRE family transcriptional regulator
LLVEQGTVAYEGSVATVLLGNSVARVIVGDQLPRLELVGLMGTVCIGLTESGAALLEVAIQRARACTAEGAHSGHLPIAARSLNYPDNLGIRLRLRRERLGLTASEVARRMTVAGSEVSRTESGQKRPALAVVAKFSRVLGVPLDVLLAPGHQDLALAAFIAEEM